MNFVGNAPEKRRIMVQTIAGTLFDHFEAHVAESIYVSVDTTLAHAELLTDILHA